jgi:hypothetical protein
MLLIGCVAAALPIPTLQTGSARTAIEALKVTRVLPQWEVSPLVHLARETLRPVLHYHVQRQRSLSAPLPSL